MIKNISNTLKTPKNEYRVFDIYQNSINTII